MVTESRGEKVLSGIVVFDHLMRRAGHREAVVGEAELPSVKFLTCLWNRFDVLSMGSMRWRAAIGARGTMACWCSRRMRTKSKRHRDAHACLEEEHGACL